MKTTQVTTKDIQKYSKYPLPLAASYLQLSVNELRLQTQKLGFFFLIIFLSFRLQTLALFRKKEKKK